MSIIKEQIPFIDFISNEIKTLGIIKANTSIQENYFDLYNKSGYLHDLYSGKKNLDKIKFNFSSKIDMIIEKREMTLFIECLISPEYSQSSYAISILNKVGESLELFRKFHFDFDKEPQKVEKPCYHIQYGGKATPLIVNNNVDDSAITPWLSSPRIRYQPINLALILDFIFCEFPSEINDKIKEDSHWRDFIKNNEVTILKEHFKNINSFFTGLHSNNYLYRDFCYGGQ